MWPFPAILIIPTVGTTGVRMADHRVPVTSHDLQEELPEMTLRDLVGAPGAAAFMSAMAFCAMGGTTQAQTPDVIVYDVGVDGGDLNDIHYWGQNGGIAAYSIATQSCNSGTATLDWFDAGGDTRHPVIAMNMFRWDNGRIEQIGQSWLKHGFCALSEPGCGTCSATPCS